VGDDRTRGLDVDGFVLKPAGARTTSSRASTASSAVGGIALREGRPPIGPCGFPTWALEGSRPLPPVSRPADVGAGRQASSPSTTGAIGRTLAQPITTAGGMLVVPEETVVTRDVLDFLGDLVDIGVLPRDPRRAQLAPPSNPRPPRTPAPLEPLGASSVIDPRSGSWSSISFRKLARRGVVRLDVVEPQGARVTPGDHRGQPAPYSAGRLIEGARVAHRQASRRR